MLGRSSFVMLQRGKAVEWKYAYDVFIHVERPAGDAETEGGNGMTEQDEKMSTITRLYQELLIMIKQENTPNIGVHLCEVLPILEKELFVKWCDGLTPIYDKNDLRNNDKEAIDFVLTLPYHLRKMAFLCGSNHAIQHASNLMKIRELFMAAAKKAGMEDKIKE